MRSSCSAPSRGVAAGFPRAQTLELIARLALSVLANYAGHLTRAPIDEPLRPQYR